MIFFSFFESNSEMSKTVFPYELYSDVSMLKQATEFPHYKFFTSSLKSSYSEKFLDELAKIVEEKLNTQEWVHICQIIKYYNIGDVNLFALENNKMIYSNDGKVLLGNKYV